MQDPISELERVAAAYTESVGVAAQRRAERDEVIAVAFAEGMPIRVIAMTVGLSAARVSDVLGRPMGKPGRPRGPLAGATDWGTGAAPTSSPVSITQVGIYPADTRPDIRLDVRLVSGSEGDGW